MSTNLYNLIDLEANSIQENLTSNEIAKLIDTYPTYVSYVARHNITIKHKYKIERVCTLPPRFEPRYPRELLDEWDRVTKMFRVRGFVNEKVF